MVNTLRQALWARRTCERERGLRGRVSHTGSGPGARGTQERQQPGQCSRTELCSQGARRKGIGDQCLSKRAKEAIKGVVLRAGGQGRTQRVRQSRGEGFVTPPRAFRRARGRSGGAKGDPEIG